MAIHRLIFFVLVCTFILLSTDGESRKELRNNEVKQRTPELMGNSIQSMRIDPSRVIQLSWRPRVFLYRTFLSNEECDYLISLGKREYAMGSGRDADTIKLPMNSTISRTEDVVAAKIEERISAWTFLPKANSKPLEILHFEHEGRKQSFNYLGNKSSLVPSKLLMATVILYLSNVSQGGQIIFPESEAENSQLKRMIRSECIMASDTVLKPTKGNAILFFGTYPNGTTDKSSNHARCPVTEGEMWCATKLFYLKAAVVEKAQLQSEDGDCTDEDESCSVWAALGECQKNPVFMTGSPDYYGTCRKSCKSC